MLEKLSKFEQRFREVELLLADTANSDNPKLLAELGKEYSQLESKSKTFHKYDDLLKSIESLKQIISSEDDKELVELAKEELNEELLRQTNLEEEIQVLLLPEDPNDQRNVFVEIRAAAGGDEAALFAGDIYRMYSRYSQIANWNLEIMSMNETGIGGYKEIVFSVQGENVYKKLKYESGAHRVQRVPSTESSGRIHTSTITVAVLPEADDVDVDINDNDLRIDIFHAGGHGGQNVNKIESRVEIIFDLEDSKVLNDYQKEILKRNLKNKLVNNSLRLAVQEHRNQLLNRQLALMKFSSIIKNALNKPFKLRKYTQPTKASQKKRVEVKKKRGELKKSRQKEKHIKYE